VRQIEAQKISVLTPSFNYARFIGDSIESILLPSRIFFLRIGRMVHGLWKSASGAYARQSRAREFRGVDMRWFVSDFASEAVETLIRTAYAEEVR
jgi:hypothetical protein